MQLRGDLRARVSLQDGAGNVLSVQDNVYGLSFSAALPAAGTYKVSVTPTGSGDPLTTGYSSYGELWGGGLCAHGHHHPLAATAAAGAADMRPGAYVDVFSVQLCCTGHSMT